LGNHELDNGVSGLTPFIENLTCPVLAANLILTKVPELEAEQNLMKSVVFNINGTKIGVIGYLTPDTKVLAIRNDVDYIEEVEAVKEEAANLKARGINILIALGHSGFTKDLEIAKKVDDIDLVIGGHTNTFLWNGTSPDVEKPDGPYPTMVKQKSGKFVPAVQAYAYTKYLGKLHLVFNSDGDLISHDGNPVLLDKNIPQDLDVLNVVNRYSGDVKKITEFVVGTTSVILDGISCRLRECNMGNLITDAMVFKYASEYKGLGWTDAPIAIMQGGGIRSSIIRRDFPANVTKGDLLSVMPFDGNMVVATVNGSVIKSMLEHSVARYNSKRPPGQFLQISGLSVVYDFSKQPLRRVISVSVRCGLCIMPSYSALNDSKSYNVLMTSFLSMGGDGFSMLNNNPTTALDYDELISTTKFFETRSPIFPGIENRVIINNQHKISNSATQLTLPLIFYTLSVIAIFISNV
jgi:5'-nucleotidase